MKKDKTILSNFRLLLFGTVFLTNCQSHLNQTSHKWKSSQIESYKGNIITAALANGLNNQSANDLADCVMEKIVKKHPDPTPYVSVISKEPYLEEIRVPNQNEIGECINELKSQ